MTLIFQKIKSITKLRSENRALKEEVEELQKTIARLETKISGLQKANAHGRRGLPWR